MGCSDGTGSFSIGSGRTGRLTLFLQSFPLRLQGGDFRAKRGASFGIRPNNACRLVKDTLPSTIKHLLYSGPAPICHPALRLSLQDDHTANADVERWPA